MAITVNRDTKQVRWGDDILSPQEGGPPRDPAQFVIYRRQHDVEIAALKALQTAGVPVKHWKISPGDLITEMSQAEKDALDASLLAGLLAAAKGARITALRTALDAFVDARYTPNQKTSLNLLWTEGEKKGWTNRNVKLQSWLDWGKSLMDYLASKAVQITGATTLAAVTAVTWDFQQFAATDPAVSVLAIKGMEN